MVLQYPIRLPPIALASADPVQLRRDSSEPVEAFERALSNVRPTVVNDAAAVVTFGAQALGLARSALRVPADANASELTDPNDINAPLPRSADPAGTQAALASAIGPNVSSAALASALDPSAQAALLRAPGVLDQQSGLFREPATRESGFFRSEGAESGFPRPLSSDAFESTFPRAPNASNTLESGFFRSESGATESGFPRALSSDAFESTFPRAPGANGSLESTFPRAAGAEGARESGFFRFASAAAPAAFALAAQSSPSLFPRATVNATQAATRATITNAQSLFTGAPVAQIVPSTVRRTAPSNTPEPVRALIPIAEAQALRASLEETRQAPRTPADDADATPARAPLSANSGSTLARTPATNPETAIARAPVANNDEAGLFRTPGAGGPQASPETVEPASAGRATSGERTTLRAEELSAQQRREVQNLARNDRDVRGEEAALRAAAGGYTRGSRVRYQMGPDGRRYAVEGQVTFDVTPVPGDPAATLRKMEVVSRAASAAANPSAADRAAAARAEQLMSQARAQLAAERYTEARQLIERE